MDLLKTVINEGWTQSRLGVEIRRRTGPKKGGGRKLALPASRNEARQQIIARLSPGLRWLEQVKDGGKYVTGFEKKIGAAIDTLEALVTAAGGRSMKSR